MKSFAFILFGAFVLAEEKARASHILVKEKQDCLDIKAAIAEESDVAAAFARHASEKSTCPSGKSGGDLGEFGKGAMVPEFEKVIFDYGKEIKTVQGCVKTQFGYHLIFVTERAAKEITE